MIIVLIVLLILLTPQLLWAPMDFDRGYNITTYNDFSKGLNLFSSPDNVKDNQALNLNNFLFYGVRLRARKGIQPLNATSLGSEPITGIHEFRKSGGFSEILAASNGLVWLYDEDIDSFSTFLKFTTDTAGSVLVTQNDSTVKGYQTNYTSLGYSDSIPIIVNDSTHYIYQILSDTLLYLYSQFKGDTDTTADLTKPFRVDESKPTQFETWLDYEFIPGLQGVGKYDGAEFDTTTIDTTEYESDTAWYDGASYVVAILPTSGFGITANEWNDYYVVSYNDTATSPKLNIPLRIEYSSNSRISVWADTSWIEGGHLDSTGGGQTFKIIAPLTAENLVYAGIVDSVNIADVTNGIYYLYDTSQTWAGEVLDFGYHVIRELDTTYKDKGLIRIKNDGNYNYLYTFMKPSYWTLVAGDSFEVYRLSSATVSEAPRYIAHWQDRQWRAGYADAPNYLWWSHIFDPDSSEGDYYAYVEQDDGDVITALKVLSFQDALLVLKTKHIYSITGEGPLGWWINDLVDGIGTPSQASVISYGRSVYFYDYTGFFSFDSYNPVKISWQIEKIVADSINKDYAHQIVGGYFDQHLWWSYPSGTATKNNRTILYNLEDEAWTKVDINASAYFVGQIETDSNGVLIGDPDSGKVYRYGLSYLDGSSSYDATYESPWFDVRDEYDFVKDFKDLHIFYDKHDSTIIYIDYLKDFVDSVIWTDTIGVDDNDVPTYHRRAIQGDMLAQRIKMDIRVERIDGEFYLPLFRIKWKPVGEVLYDE